MFNVLEVVEELAVTAYERGTNTISMAQIERELDNATQDDARNIEEVCRSLSDLGYAIAE